MKKLIIAMSLISAMAASAYDYNVRMPSTAARPRWSGAKVGEWTLDYKTACTQAKAEGRGVLVFTTGSWWCPHCEAFEEKVLLQNASKWNNYVQENGFYLVMLDFPYRGHVTDDQLWKSRYPEYGDGWGFQCWLYDDDFLAENGLSKEDGLNAIMDLYRVQQSLALEGASPVSIKTWDGKEDFNYGKVGYPTLVVFLPDGSEAGRFSPGSTNREADDAYNYVVEKIDSIIGEALNEECGLCSDPDEWGLSGNRAENYRGWINDGDNGIIGTFEAKTSKKNAARDIKITAKVVVGGKTKTLSGTGHDCCIDTVILGGKKETDPHLELMFSDDGVKGTYIDGEKSCVVKGARNVFSSKDPAAKARKSLVVPGTWNLAMAVTNSPSAMADGFGTFSVKITKSGSASLKGKLPDGTSISASSKVIIGDSDAYCVPFVVSNRKYSFGCCLWFKNGWFFNVTDNRAWESIGKTGFTAGWRAIYSAVPGFGEIKDELELVMQSLPATISGLPVVSDPDGDTITVKRTTWTGTEDSMFKATLKKSTGEVNGTMKFQVKRTNGNVTAKSCKVNGVVIDGTAYCNALISKQASYQLKVSSCNACED